MIRRGFWLVVGAAGGIAGYRRAAALGRSLSGTLMLTPGAEPERPAPRSGQAVAPRPASRERKTGRVLVRQTIRLSRDARRFNRDVKEGMDLYMVRHPGRPGPTLGAGQAGTDHDERAKDDR